MNKIGWLSELYYEVGKQQTNFRLTHTYKKDGAILFTKWVKYLDAQSKDEIINAADQREQLKNEIIFDQDEGDFKELIGKLRKDGIKFYAYSTEENRARQIHTYWKGLAILKKKEREDVRTLLIRKYGCDLNLRIDAHVIPIEFEKHWKTGKTKNLIDKEEGINNAEPLIEEIDKINKEKEIKTQSILGLKIDNFQDNVIHFWKINHFFYDETNIFWFWDKLEFRWRMVDDVFMMSLLDKRLGFCGQTVTSTIKSNYLESFKRVGRDHKPKPAPTKWIQFKDKAISLKSGNVYDVTHDYFFTNPIPWNIGNNENTPIMDKLIVEWVGEEYKQTAYEIIAYCCYSDYPIHMILCLVGCGRNGKCQKGTDKVLMENGKWKYIKDIKIGEKIISPQKGGSSKIVKVINTHNRFEEDIYDVYEKRRKKRLLYTCAGNHLIPIIRTWTKRTSKDDSTPRISERRLFEYDARHISKLDNTKSQICSFTTSAIEYKKSDAKINPYCLGAWLGDGHFSIRKWDRGMKNPKYNRGKNGIVTCKGLGITSMDKEIINEFYDNYGKDMRGITDKPNNRASTYRLAVNGKFAKELTQLGLMGKGCETKFIPKKCLLSSINYRNNLLAGLIDTDGFVQKKTGAIYYVTKSKQLSKNIKDLVFSLGGYCEIRLITKKSQNGNKGNYFELSIQFKNYDIPLRLKRKKERLFNKKYDPRNVAIECIKTKPQQVYGIEIDGDSKWYITNDWMITHNSKFLGLINNFIGKDNVCSTELDVLLDSRFESFKLFKKLVCTMGETNFGVISKTSLLKKLTGQDLIGFEYKQKKPFDDYNYAKIIISSNSLPPSEDTSEGFYRRWLILDFPNTFPEGHDILKTIPEIEYNNLALKVSNILPKLLENGKFNKQGTIKERMEKYIMASNPLSFFIKEHCKRGYDCFMRYSELYVAYRKYLHSIKRRKIGYKEFNDVLTIEGFEVVKTSKRIGEEYVNGRFIEGIELVPLVPLMLKSSTLSPYRERVSDISTNVTNVTNEEPIFDTIHAKCTSCGSTPSHIFNKQGQPLCETCYKAEQAQKQP